MTEILKEKYDTVIIGGGMAGLTTAIELLNHKQKVLLIDRDKQEKLGGLAKKSFGGILLVDTPYQRKSGVKDSKDLALSDWFRYADFEKDSFWPKEWARHYIEHSQDIIFPWLRKMKVKFLPLVNWPERGYLIKGNSVPRWHITWGTGSELIALVLKHLQKHPNKDSLTMLFEHKVESLQVTRGRVSACLGTDIKQNKFKVKAKNFVIAAGGISGGDLSLVRKYWPKYWGRAPGKMVNGSHLFADGTLHFAAEKIGAKLTHLNKHWHYAAGVFHPRPEKENDGLSLVPPRSALWFNAKGERFTPPLVGYTDTYHFVDRVSKSPGGYSWQIMNWKIAIKELAVSGSEYMSAFVNKSKLALLRDLLFGNKRLVRRLIAESEDFITADNLKELVEKMNKLEKRFKVDYQSIERAVKAYDDEIDRGKAYFNDDQLRRIMNFRTYKGDRIRVCKFQKINDKKAGPLIAVREHILARKSLGGIQTDLQCRVLDKNSKVIKGLYAVGESAGFGGGGIHGKRSLEGTFLGSCILTGNIAASSIAEKSN